MRVNLFMKQTRRDKKRHKYPRWVWCYQVAVVAGSVLWGGCPGHSGLLWPLVAETGEHPAATITRTWKRKTQKHGLSARLSLGAALHDFPTREWAQCRGQKPDAFLQSPETPPLSLQAQMACHHQNLTNLPPWIYRGVYDWKKNDKTSKM